MIILRPSPVLRRRSGLFGEERIVTQPGAEYYLP